MGGGNCLLLTPGPPPPHTQAIALSLILGPGAYLKSGWNWIDFVTTFSSYITYLPAVAGNNNMSGIRALRALRPLRTLNVIPGGCSSSAGFGGGRRAAVCVSVLSLSVCLQQGFEGVGGRQCVCLYCVCLSSAGFLGF